MLRPRLCTLALVHARLEAQERRRDGPSAAVAQWLQNLMLSTVARALMHKSMTTVIIFATLLLITGEFSMRACPGPIVASK